MANKDLLVKRYIDKHYKEMMDEIHSVNNSYNEFVLNETVQKAVSFDLFQIGELFNNLSDEVKNKLNKKDVRGIIDVRNFIAHGYIYIKISEIWQTIHHDVPRLIGELDKNLK